MGASDQGEWKRGTVTRVVPEWDLGYVRDPEWAYPVRLSRMRNAGVTLAIDMVVEFTIDRAFRIGEIVVDHHRVHLRDRSLIDELIEPSADCA